jgi:predicted patatin/cPLA2 family phospholipase
MKDKILFLLFISLSALLCQIQKKCRLLALQGGGDKESYQAGALHALVYSLPSEETQWDIITGISAGSLNTLGMSSFKQGEEKQAVEFILKLWRNIKSWKDIYKRWAFPLMKKSGIYNNAPLKEFLKSTMEGRKVERKIIIGAVDLIEGEYKTWDETSLKSNEDLISAVLSSASVPAVFPFQSYDNGHFVDGGVNVGVDLLTGINKCFEMGFEEKDIIVDTILCGKLGMDENKKSLHTLGVLTRVLEIIRHNNSIRDVVEAVRIYPEINFRYLVAPEKMLPSGSVPLHFKPKQIEEMIKLGETDGKKAVNKGEGSDYKNLLMSRKQTKGVLYTDHLKFLNEE